MKIPNGKLSGAELAAKSLELMRQTGRLQDPYLVAQLELSLSPLKKGTLGARIGSQLHQMLASHALAQQFQPAPDIVLPDVPAARRIFVGHEIRTGRPIYFDLHNLVKHALFVGATGSGKTTLLKQIIRQLVCREISGEFWDHKREGDNLAGAITFKPHEEPINWLEPIGHPETYFVAWCGEFGRAFSVKSETWTELVSILSRITAGLRPGDLFPSLFDFERILFRMGEKEGRAKFATAAFALRSLNAVLGKTAFIRKAPDIRGRYPVTVYDYQGLPHRIHAFLTAIRLLRMQLQATQEVHHG